MYEVVRKSAPYRLVIVRRQSMLGRWILLPRKFHALSSATVEGRKYSSWAVFQNDKKIIEIREAFVKGMPEDA